jgi:geranylgeranyl pyrophosphate synthase
MVGDFLMSRAYELSARVAAGASGEIAEALGTACEGRVRELRTSFDLRLSDADALAVVERKTAILFALPCRLGARLGGAPPAQVDALTTFGRHTGIAFQLADDVLALTGRASQLGKVAGADPENGVYGLPVLRAARNGAGPELRRLLQGRPGREAVDEALRLVAAGSAPAEVLALAGEHVRRARAALSPVPDGPARRALDALAVYAVARAPGAGPDLRAILSPPREAP